jgi:vacuolar-type H+-ATPase subunit E/Vma4
MSLEKILKKIIDEAQEEADRILLENQKKAEEIKENAQKEASGLADALMKEAERQGNLEASRIITQARLQKRLNVLSCKKRLIDEVLDRAFQQEGLEKRELTRKIILKEGEKEESFDEKRLIEDLRPRLEKYIVEMLKI